MSYQAHLEADRLRAQIRALEQQMARSTRQITGAEADELRNIQSRFDHAGSTIGERPNEPAMGQKPIEYRRQLCSQYAKHSDEFKNTRFDFADSAMLDVVEPKVLAQVRQAGYSNVKPGVMVPERIEDGSGRVITKWHGDPNAWLQFFKSPPMTVTIPRPEGNRK
jgi:hypothetical protein